MSPGTPQRPTKRPETISNLSSRGSATPDYSLTVILAILVALGLVMVYSASFVTEGNRFFLLQVLWIILGVMVAFAMARIPYSVWRRMAIPIMLVALAGLVAVLFVGEPINGARRTFFGSIQPSEFAKLAVVIYISAWVASKGEKLADYRGGLIPFTIIMGLVTLLLVLEPSFSVAVIILTIGLAIFFIGGGDVKQMLALAVIAVPALLLLLQRSGYGFKRIENWLQEFWNLKEAAGTIGSTVPLPWSDYLFAHIGTRLGFIGAVAVVGLYAALCYRCLGIALNAPDKFAALMAVGITTWIMVQTAIHMGTSLALIPKTGQPLPLMSYGGSSMLMCMAAMGLMQSIARASPVKRALYASFVIGGRDRRPRVSDPGSGQRAPDHARKQPGTASQKKPIQPKTRKSGRGTTGSSGQPRRQAGVSFGVAASRVKRKTLGERLRGLGRRPAKSSRRTATRRF
jgi:cell division protein FtsW